jgi:hypothetical protein
LPDVLCGYKRKGATLNARVTPLGLPFIVGLVVTAAAMATAASGMAAALESGAVFAFGAVAGVAYVALWVTCFVAVEVVEGLLTVLGHRSGVAMTRIVTVVYVTVEATAAVIPGTGSDEEAACEPVGPIVTVGGAGVGSVVEVSVRAYRSCPDVD